MGVDGAGFGAFEAVLVEDRVRRTARRAALRVQEDWAGAGFGWFGGGAFGGGFPVDAFGDGEVAFGQTGPAVGLGIVAGAGGAAGFAEGLEEVVAWGEHGWGPVVWVSHEAAFGPAFAVRDASPPIWRRAGDAGLPRLIGVPSRWDGYR